MADNVTTQTATLATIPTSTVIETRDQGSGVERQVVQVRTGFRVSANFTRPADTTAYATNDLVANSTTAGSVTPMSWAIGNSTAVTQAKSTYHITAATLKKSTTSNTSATFLLWLFLSDPSASSGILVGDNAAGSAAAVNTPSGGAIGPITLPGGGAFCPLADSFLVRATVLADPGLVVRSTDANTIYGLLFTNATYTPGNAEVFTLTLEGYID